MIEGARIVLGVGGGIAAYKSAILARELLRRGAKVRVAMTPAATRFVGPVTFTGLVSEAPVVDLWDPRHPGEIHVELAAWASAMVIAPATASLLARIATGLADDPVTATIACCDRPMLLAPAMHHRMWASAAVRSNVATLASRGFALVGPVEGPLASGESGMGRMAEPEAIADALAAVLAPGDLRGRTLLVSAGPTHEAIDPVRFLGNRSSGRMGYAIAERAKRRGARVILVSGPVAIPAPTGVEVVRVRSALEMQAAIVTHVPDVDAIVMAAAVADFRPRDVAAQKIKKRDDADDAPVIELVRNPDILAGLGAARREHGGARPVLVGFAVETERLLEAARRKLEKKQIDLVVANHAAVAFEGDDNEATLVTHTSSEETGRITKLALADRILDRVRELIRAQAAL